MKRRGNNAEAQPELWVRLLGEISVQVGDVEVAMGKDRPAALLAWLALSPPRVSTSDLGHLSHREVSTDLRRLIGLGDTSLGKRIHPESERGWRRLTPEVRVDVREFRLRLDRAEAQMAQGPELAESEIQELLDVGCKTFLPGLGLNRLSGYPEDSYFDDRRREHLGRVGRFFTKAIAWAQGTERTAVVEQWLDQWLLLGGDNNMVTRVATSVSLGEDVDSIAATIRTRTQSIVRSDMARARVAPRLDDRTAAPEDDQPAPLLAPVRTTKRLIRQLAKPDHSASRGDALSALEALGLARDGRLTENGREYRKAIESNESEGQRQALASALSANQIVVTFLAEIRAAGGLTAYEAEERMRSIEASGEPHSASRWIDWIRCSGLIAWDATKSPGHIILGPSD